MEANNGVAGMDRAGVRDEERGQCESVYPSREEKEMICTLTPSFLIGGTGLIQLFGQHGLAIRTQGGQSAP